MKFLYTDIDSVLSLGSEMNPVLTKWGNVHRFNTKAVKVYNEILSKTGAEIVVSSDWKHHYNLEQLQEIFTEWAKISKAPIDVTPYLWGIKFTNVQQLEECRAAEILAHVKKFNPESWVAIDDLDLRNWLPEENFVFLPRFMEGIKQTGKAQETILKLNINDK